VCRTYNLPQHLHCTNAGCHWQSDALWRATINGGASVSTCGASKRPAALKIFDPVQRVHQQQLSSFGVCWRAARATSRWLQPFHDFVRNPHNNLPPPYPRPWGNSHYMAAPAACMTTSFHTPGGISSNTAIPSSHCATRADPIPHLPTSSTTRLHRHSAWHRRTFKSYTNQSLSPHGHPGGRATRAPSTRPCLMSTTNWSATVYASTPRMLARSLSPIHL